MSTDREPTGNTSVPTLNPSPETKLNAHNVQLYTYDSFLLYSLTKLIGTTLIAGDVAFVVATREHREGLAQRLKALGLDIEVSARLGRYCAFDAAEALSGFIVDGVLNSSLFDSFIKYILSSIRPSA